MRGPLPLSDSDFAAVRAKVLAEIERPRRSYGWAFALAASVVVAVLSIIAARQPLTRPLAVPRATLSPLREERVTQQASAPLVQRQVRGAHTRKATPPPPTQIARIELRTADPDIRIIWITNQEAP